MINKRLLKEALSKRSYIPTAVVYGVLNSLFSILTALFMALLVDGIFIKKSNLKDMKIYILLFLINAVVKFLFNLFIEKHIKNCAEDIKEQLRRKAFNLILSSNPYRIKNIDTGRIINLLTEGFQSITSYYSQYIPQIFSAFLIPALICIFTAMADKLSALIMIITYPIIPLFMVLIGYKTEELNNNQWNKLNTLSSHFLDVLQGLSTLKLFGRSKIQEEKVYEISEDYRKGTMEVLKVTFLSSLVLELTATISIAVLAVNLGLRLVYSKIDFLQAFFILIIAPDFYLPLRQLGLKFHSSLNGKIAVEKLEELEKELEEREDNCRKAELEKDKFTVEVKNLSFTHRNREALNNISFKISSKEKVAIVGESGSGKSTLINILSGFLKVNDGTVFINGIDINLINRESYLRNIALVPQFPHIFDKSIKDNILLSNRETDLKEFYNVCRTTKVEEFAVKYKDRYDTAVGEGERVIISGGERQRIAAARAVLKNTPFIILDEPTSALDPETEEIIPELLKGYLKDKTLLIAAHRLNTIKAADKILVLQEGYLVESGSHEELMAKRGRYFEFWRKSYEDF
ncbi:thiol reductant ABC exporter subunit CydD [Clostridium sp. A1-XYC3]|uniref:Thiol reductant ABC exporter subunit CydD n=1 Tax=Clostridium tanneri TaxID=3037988 RepID=A0ABU4JWS6_9CLOT|nr:thiol reductant ABC exporter subunit CydD [Clostridium sp. A1-XYC3]MDW8802614.1 thiol reductant ABC exporter subunit CydD [Clostridium sp. A1-XYC3]